MRLWPDLSPSMTFQSHLAAEPKRDRALVLAFAIGELALAGGERVGLLGGKPPSTGRNTVQKIALSLARQEKDGVVFPSLPQRSPLQPLLGVHAVQRFSRTARRAGRAPSSASRLRACAAISFIFSIQRRKRFPIMAVSNFRE